MIYLLLALVVLTVTALLVAPRLGFLLLFSTTGLLAYEYEVARYVLLFIVAMNVLIVLVLLGATLHARMKKRISEQSRASDISDSRPQATETGTQFPRSPE